MPADVETPSLKYGVGVVRLQEAERVTRIKISFENGGEIHFQAKEN